MLALFCPRACAPLPTAAIKFPVQLEKAWLLASVLGFTLDVGVYHTFSLFVRSVMKLLVSEEVGGGKAGRARGHPCTFVICTRRSRALPYVFELAYWCLFEDDCEWLRMGLAPSAMRCAEIKGGLRCVSVRISVRCVCMCCEGA